MTDERQENEINVRSQSYSIARSTSICPHCGAGTQVVALLLPPGHRTRSEVDDLEASGLKGSELQSGSWDVAARCALLFYVGYLPETVVRHLQHHAPMFGPALSVDTQEQHWANHCERCRGIQEDHSLFCEPQGAFVPMNAVQAAAIELVAIEESLEAAAGGYALDPEFIEFEHEA